MRLEVRRFTDAFGTLSLKAESQAEKHQIEALRIALTEAGLRVSEFHDFTQQGIVLRIQPTEQ